MKRIILGLLFILIFNHNGVTQIIGQDSEAYTSILLPSTTLSSDLTNKVTNFSLIDTFKFLNHSDKSTFLYGIELAGQSENAILPVVFNDDPLESNIWGNLLLAGTIDLGDSEEEKFSTVTDLEMPLVKKRLELRYKIINYYSIDTNSVELGKKAIKIKSQIINHKNSIKESFCEAFQDELDSLFLIKEFKYDLFVFLTEGDCFNGNKEEIICRYVTLFHYYKLLELIDLITKIPTRMTSENDIGNYKNKWKTIIKELHAIQFKLTDSKCEIGDDIKIPFENKELKENEYYTNVLNFFDLYLVESNKVNKESKKEMYKAFYVRPYIRYGLTNSNFKFYNNDPTVANFDDRFQDINFNGSDFNFGTTININNNVFFGLSYRIREMNNLNVLTVEDYAFTQVDTTIMNGQSSVSNSVKAYTGEYIEFERTSFNVDFSWVMEGIVDSEGKKNYPILNLFFRRHDPEDFDSFSSGGVGLYHFAGKERKIKGGVFLQKNDLFDDIDSKNVVNNNQLGVTAQLAF